MLQAVLDAHARTYADGSRAPVPTPWHPIWTLWMWLSVLIDHRDVVAATLAATLFVLAIRAVALARRRRRAFPRRVVGRPHED